MLMLFFSIEPVNATLPLSHVRISVVDFREPQISKVFQIEMEYAIREEFRTEAAKPQVNFIQITLPSAKLESALKQIIADQPRVVYLTSFEIAKLFRTLNTDIPVIFSGATDPRTVGLIKSFERPGNNMTGFISYTDNFEAKRRLILEGSPYVKLIAMIVEKGKYSEAQFGIWNQEARKNSLKIVPMEFSLEATDREIESAIRRSNADAFDLPASPFLRRRHKIIISAVNKTQKPAMYPYHGYVKLGGLMSYSHIEPDFAKVSAKYLRQALSLKNTGDIPIQLPNKFVFTINLDSASKLKTPLRKAFVKRADQFAP
jgi:putative tryptophan/tyrosine transport system substrate-binding protein